MAGPIPRRRLLLGVPLAGAAVAGGASLLLLARMRSGTYDPRGIPNPRIGLPVPAFSLPAQTPSATGFSSADIHRTGHPLLVNFFASWCIPCQDEAQSLMDLRQQNDIPIWGIAYKDQPAAAEGFLNRNGNPYTRLASDPDGRTAIDFGVYGVPETYFIDAAGIVRWRWAGALTADAGMDQLHALMRRYA